MTRRLCKLGAKIASIGELARIVRDGGLIALGEVVLPPQVAAGLRIGMAISAIAKGRLRRVKKGEARGTDNKEGSR